MLLRAISFALSLLISSLALAGNDAKTDTTLPAKAAQTPITRPALGQRSQAETAALERQLAANEQQQLKTQADDGFLALWRPANTGNPKGAVVLIPGNDESADWPIGIGPLRRKLPDTGWGSLSLTLPDAETTPLSKTKDEPASSPDTTTETTSKAEPVEPQGEQQEKPGAPAEATSDPAEQDEDTTAAIAPKDDTSETVQQGYTEQVFARIAAGITFAQQQGAKTVVLAGQGTGAYWAARYLAEQQPPNVTNLLLVSAQEPDSFSPDLVAVISELKLAAGDFYYRDQAVERNAAKQRLNAAKRQKQTAYIQIAMNSLPGNREVEQEQLFRRIKGWLNLHLQSKPNLEQ